MICSYSSLHMKLQAYEMHCAKRGSSERFFPTHLQSLDTLLQGGIPAGCITEVSNSVMQRIS